MIPKQIPFKGFVRCEYGDMDESCESKVQANPSVCRLNKVDNDCCSTCFKLYKEDGSFLDILCICYL